MLARVEATTPIVTHFPSSQVNDRTMEALIHGSFLTLTALDISHCNNITEDALGWIAGALGVTSRPASKLTTLNASHCPGFRDKGLLWLGKSCRQLRYLNLSSCTQISSVGILGLSRCVELRVLNLAHVDIVDDHGVLSIARNCPMLKSLNLK